MPTFVAVVPKEEGESARLRLKEAGVLRRDREIRERDGELLIPVTRDGALGYPVESATLDVRTRPPHSYQDLVQVPEELRPLLPRAFDMVGHVVIVRLPDALRPYEGAIGDAFLRVHRGAKTVAVDGGVKGSFRERALRVIAGREETRTLHHEFGLALALDPAEVHFSPRMASERRRVAGLLGGSEVVVDAFSGVGPFALHAARAGARSVYAVDANPRAVAFLRENIRRNRADAVTALEGPIEEVVPQFDPADRFILDYPWDPLPYVPLAVEALQDGGVLHYYEIMERAEQEGRIEALHASVAPNRTLKVEASREVRGYSPTQSHVALDLRIGPG